MTDRPATTSLPDRIESALDALPPTTRSVVRERVREPSDFPAAVARAAGAAVGARERALREVATAVSFLAAYRRLRVDLLDPGSRYGADERDVAVLASDHLHASAHEALARAPLPAERRLACYGELTAGSASLAERLLAEAADARSDVHRFPSAGREPSSRAVLVGTGGAVGAAAAGGTDEVIAPMRTYGESLTAALERTEPETTAPFERLRAVLDGDVPGRAGAALAGPGSRRTGDDGLKDALEAARGALDVLPDSAARTRLERATNLLSLGVERSGE